jgi:hypothetical protein
VTPSTINLYFDSDGRTLLHRAITHGPSDVKDAKDCILKVLQMGADVTQECRRHYINELPVETAVKCKKSKWTFLKLFNDKNGMEPNNFGTIKFAVLKGNVS